MTLHRLRPKTLKRKRSENAELFCPSMVLRLLVAKGVSRLAARQLEPRSYFTPVSVALCWRQSFMTLLLITLLLLCGRALEPLTFLTFLLLCDLRLGL